MIKNEEVSTTTDVKNKYEGDLKGEREFALHNQQKKEKAMFHELINHLTDQKTAFENAVADRRAAMTAKAAEMMTNKFEKRFVRGDKLQHLTLKSKMS